MLVSSTKYWVVLLHILNNVSFSDAGSDASYDTCDENSIPSSTSPSNLTPNNFHKICPGTYDSSKPLSQPICGDGTAFSFYYHKPAQRYSNKDKFIVEFQGGGACWDENSCNKQQGLLTFPTDLDGFVGYSCSEVNYGMDNYGGYPINLLCADTIGDMDLSEYNYIFVPYCSQDVHMGDSSSTYSDDDGGNGVYHHGAHNMMGALNWIYKHFPNPSHVFLTGCSAGGTVLPVAYDLINNHYNSFLKGGRTVNINTIIDSAVYLTPAYFLEYGIDNWNPWTILDKTAFPYDEYKYTVQYSTRLWEHVLRRGSNNDKWGFVTHTNDPVSIAYWQAMGGGYGDDDDNDNDDEGTWSSDLENSLSTIQDEFSNVDVFYIDGQGHCSFGLQYALQEDGFEEFAENIIQEQQLVKKTSSSAPLFALSFILGSLLVLTASLAKAQNEDNYDDSHDFADMNDDDSSEARTKRPRWLPTFFRKKKQSRHQGDVSQSYSDDFLPERGYDTRSKAASALDNVTDRLIEFFGALVVYSERFEKCPVTAGLFLATTLYFILMLIYGGFAHPLNNPALGPPAQALSTFGINNPTLIVMKNQIIRLFTSNFLCSGVITYLMYLGCIFKCMRHIEAALSSTLVFGMACFIIAFGSNLIYTLFGQGASCGSLALVLGINVFSIVMSKKISGSFPRPWGSTFWQMLFAITLFPFNSWIMIVSAMVLGGFVVPLAIENDNFYGAQKETDKISKTPLKVIGGVYSLLFILILANVPRPNDIYQHPYLTGCSMMYTPDLDSVQEAFGGRRKLGDYDGLCAQFCVPHLISKPFYWSVSGYTEYGLYQGTCPDMGYTNHVADKTMTFYGYSLDVEGYYLADDDGGN